MMDGGTDPQADGSTPPVPVPDCAPGETKPCTLNECGGVYRCIDGHWGASCEVSAGVEVCDGADNDCDGVRDEGFAKNACGGCGPAPTEICDGRDNDCDGQVDEGVTNACGACGAEPTEVCDGRDNDCDGQVDEGYVKNACGTCGAVPAEVFDGKDNDCDGYTDEGHWTDTYDVAWWTLQGYKAECAGGSHWSACQVAADSWCRAKNGNYASGWVVTYGSAGGDGNYAQVACLATGAPIVTRFVSASDLGLAKGFPMLDYTAKLKALSYCNSRGYESVIGPTSWTGALDSAVVQCVSKTFGWTVTQPKADLQGCNTFSGDDMNKTFCMNSVHYWCRNHGWATGYGPFASDSTNVSFECLADGSKN